MSDIETVSLEELPSRANPSGEDLIPVLGDDETTIKKIRVKDLPASTAAQSKNEKGMPGGYAPLNESGQVPSINLPPSMGEGDFKKSTDTLDDILAGTTNKHFTTTEKTKLSSIESGAEANNISDTDATDLTDGGNSNIHYHSSDRDRANHTGTQTASTISDFDAEVSNNVDVNNNTNSRHNAVTVTDTNDIDLTLAGQEIKADLKATAISSKNTISLTGTEEVLINGGGTLKKTTTQAIANLGGGDMLSINNLSDVADLETAQDNLGINLNTNVRKSGLTTFSQQHRQVKKTINVDMIDWINYYGRGTITDDTTDYWKGDHSVSIVTDGAGGYCGISKSFAAPLNLENKIIRLTFKISDWDELESISLAGKQGATYPSVHLEYFSSLAKNNNEWVTLYVSFRNDNVVSSATSFNSIERLYLKIKDKGNAPIIVKLGGEIEIFEANARGSVSFVFDDGKTTVLDAEKVMSKYGLTGSVAVIRGKVGTAGYLTEADLKYLVDRGWEMITHGSILYDMTDAERVTEVNEARDWMLERGFAQWGHYINPNGFTSITFRNALKEAGYVSSATIHKYGQSVDAFDQFNINRYSFDDAMATDINNYLDKSILAGTHTVLGFHTTMTMIEDVCQHIIDNNMSVIKYSHFASGVESNKVSADGSISTHSDVDTTNQSDGYTLVYNSTTSKYESKRADTGVFMETNVAGEIIAEYDILYLHTDEKWYKANATAESTASGLMAIALENGTIDNALRTLIGTTTLSDASWAFTVGSTIYLDTTDGGMTQTAPIVTGTVVRILGYAISPTKIFLNPDNSYLVNN